MKQLLSLLYLFSITLATAQDTVPDYFAANPRWVESIGSETDVQLFIDGDTVVNGIEYYKLMATGDDVSGFDGRKGIRLQGLIRQEGRKVFYKGLVLMYGEHNNVSGAITDQTPLPSKEFMLFDYGLTLGDTLFVQDNPLFEKYIQRFPTDTAFVVFGVVEDERQIYPNSFVSVLGFESIIEGRQLLYYEGVSYHETFIAEMYAYRPSSLSCYRNDSTDMIDSRYQVPYAGNSGCDFITSVNNHSQEKEFSIYPQPCTGVLNFSESIQGFTLYNSQGKLVEQNAEETNRVNVSHLPNGLYFLHYQQNNAGQGIEKVFLEQN